MNAAVLVVDIGFRPLRVVSWKKAICDLFLGKVEIVEYSRDRTIQGVNQTWPLPAIVRVMKNFPRNKIRVKFSRINIYTRDGFKCQYCGHRFETEGLNYDHVIPRSQGGKTNWENIVTCCLPCNTKKGNRTPDQARMTLLRTPKRPKYLPLVTVNMGTKQIPVEWMPYWTTVLEP